MFDQALANQHIEFLEMLNLTGDFYGQPLKLLPWQRDVISQVYGTVRENGLRQYRFAYLEIPKKNGKTELIASLAVDHCVNDPPSGQIYCCAADREQASLVFNAAVQKIQQNRALSRLIKIVESQKRFYNTASGTVVKVLSAEAYTKHGLNPTVVIFDELHAQPNRDLWDVMTFGSGAARAEQLIWVITTAGDDPDRKSIGWEQHEYARKVQDGEIEDPTWYVRIYSAPEKADIYDETVWFAANPSLGVTISLDNVRAEAQAAKNSEAAEKLFRWLRLNQWVALKRVGWLPVTLWDATQATWTWEDLRGQECYIGLDLSSTTDLTAIAALFPPRDDVAKWRFFVEAFIPAENMPEREKRDHVPFRSWVDHGYVRATPGDSIDYASIAAHLSRMVREYEVINICADPWRIEALEAHMDEQLTDKVIRIPQTIEGMSPAMKELERMMRAGLIEHELNPCGRWTFGNVVVIVDGNENLKPNKARSIDRIDPVVALINAMAAAIRLENKQNAYERHGVREL
ncbi:MAG: terminase large subunit [Clostridia bacterium]|nr:terminase large subunit [Clostridia bacterium]